MSQPVDRLQQLEAIEQQIASSLQHASKEHFLYEITNVNLNSLWQKT